MIRKRKPPRRPRPEASHLRDRLRTAEETLRAIRAGEVDALMVNRAGNPHVVTLQGADLPYRILLDQMYAGAVTLTPDGVVVYCNRRFAEIVRRPQARIIGGRLDRFVPPAERPALESMFNTGKAAGSRGELHVRAGDGLLVPVAVNFGPLRLPGITELSGVIGVVVDATERKQQEELRTRLIEQVISAQDEERGRIARELHDETGQSLTAVLVGLRTIEGAHTLVDAIELAQQLRETAAHTLRDVGRLARGLHPGVLDDLGLTTAVTRHVQEFARLHGIAQDTKVRGLEADPPLPLVQNTVYRLLQEALTNVAKHAAAGRVSVRLRRDAAAVELRVRDDGIGFEPGTPRSGAAVADGGGLGLHGMRERAALLGGGVLVKSAPGKGTTITARIPIRRV